MASYRCPLCQRTMERDLVLFLDHTQGHVIDQIKKEHPEWVATDGICKPCLDYFQKQLSGESSQENIGPAGRQRRFLLGGGMLVMSTVLAGLLQVSRTSRPWRLLVFLTAFPALLGLIQARQRTCAFLAERGLREKGSGEEPVSDAGIREALRRRGRSILVQSLLGAAFLTLLFYFLP